VAKRIRGVMFEENLKNSMGLEFYNLSHRFGYQSPNWPYFEDVKIERIHYMAKSGVLSQRITTSMHNTTHIDAPAHVVQGTPFIRHRRFDPQEQVGADHRRRPGKGLRQDHSSA
jgi:kynurenine formamidase